MLSSQPCYIGKADGTVLYNKRAFFSFVTNKRCTSPPWHCKLFPMARIYTMNICGISEDIEYLLSPERRMKAQRFVSERDRKLSIAASLLIARGLGEYGLREKEIVYSYGRYGKPYLRAYPSIHFNVSHSGSMASAAFSSFEVGCDIELIRPYDEDVAALCFTPPEREYIRKEGGSALAFTRIWCMKESFLKALGLGLDGNMQSFSVVDDGLSFRLEQDKDRRKWKISTDVVDNHVIAVSEEDIQ